MMRRFHLIVLAVLAASAVAATAEAQTRITQRPSANSRSIQIGGYAMVGRFTFAASESFDAILGTSSVPIVGGGVTVSLPWRGLFVDVGGWHFSKSGERVFVLEQETFPLGIPLDVTIVPLEFSAGWKFRLRRLPKLIPYAAGGYTSFGYQETSSFAGAGEDLDERFGGYHLRGGADHKLWQHIQ